MERSRFFNSVNGDRKYKATDFAEYFSSLIGNGVFPNPSSNLQVISNNDMTVTIKQGKAWINGYLYINTNDLILQIEPGDGLLNRIDRIVLRLDFVKRGIKIVVNKGELATNAVAKSMQRDADAFELALADITVNKGTISISPLNITDLRLNKDMCGIVKGTIEEIDTTTLFNKFNLKLDDKIFDLEKEFKIWFKSVESQLEGNVGVNLTNKIVKIEGIVGEEPLNTTKKTATGAINEIKESMDNTNNMSKNMGEKVNKSIDDISKLTATISTLQSSLNTVSANLQNATNTINALNSTISNLQGSINTINNTVNTMQNTIWIGQ